MEGGLVEVVQFLGHHALQIQWRLIFFFLWGYIKTKVYKTTVNDTADLKERIEQGIKAIKNETLENVFDGIVKRLKFCISVNGDTFEQ